MMWNYIWRDMAAEFSYLPYGLIIGVAAAILLRMMNSNRIRRGKKPFLVIATAAFLTYLAIILFITFFSRENGSRIGMDLELFSTWGINERNNAYVIENVLLFIPYGFLGAWAVPAARRLANGALLGFLTSLGIECIQLATGRGYFQIDDILTNLLGAVIGLVLFRCAAHAVR